MLKNFRYKDATFLKKVDAVSGNIEQTPPPDKATVFLPFLFSFHLSNRP
jgi:hypothetical protein